MAKRTTKEKKYITLSEEAIEKIESMVSTWTYDTKAFVRSRLNQYKPPHPLILSFNLKSFKRLNVKFFKCSNLKENIY